MRAYSKSQKTIWDNYAVMESARLEGMEKGIEKGIEKGMEKGIEKGRKEGREEGITTMVINLFKVGISLEKISEASGLSNDEIRKILEENR
jgi:predicted transposase/invertase (TIGR01784 family)